MAIKKGDLVKVIELIGNDEFCGVELNKTYKVHRANDKLIEIDTGNMLHYQVEKVKKKSKKDLRIELLESIIKELQELFIKF